MGFLRYPGRQLDAVGTLFWGFYCSVGPERPWSEEVDGWEGLALAKELLCQLPPCDSPTRPQERRVGLGRISKGLIMEKLIVQGKLEPGAWWTAGLGSNQRQAGSCPAPPVPSCCSAVGWGWKVLSPTVLCLPPFFTGYVLGPLARAVLDPGQGPKNPPAPVACPFSLMPSLHRTHRLLQQENEELRRRLVSATRRTEALERELEIGQDCLELELGQSREELDKFKDKFRRYGMWGHTRMRAPPQVSISWKRPQI